MKETTAPWGTWEVLLDTPDYKVKRLVVNPSERLSYQKHARRGEHWTVVAGSALVTLNEREVQLGVGASIDIPIGAFHRVANNGAKPLVFIEVQTGSYFGEDDIVRLDDDYGRGDSTAAGTTKAARKKR